MIADAGSAWSSLPLRSSFYQRSPAHSPQPLSLLIQSPRLSPALPSIFLTVPHDPALKYDILPFPVLVVH